MVIDLALSVKTKNADKLVFMAETGEHTRFLFSNYLDISFGNSSIIFALHEFI